MKGESVVEPASYRIESTRHIIATRTMTGESQIPGMGHLEGVLTSPFPMSLIGEQIELELVDGGGNYGSSSVSFSEPRCADRPEEIRTIAENWKVAMLAKGWTDTTDGTEGPQLPRT